MTTSNTRNRRCGAVVLIAVVLTVGLAATSCGGDSDDSSSAKSDKSTTTSKAVPFDEGAAKLQAQLDTASSDQCKLFALSRIDLNMANPTTPEQVHTYVELTATLLDRIAATTPPALAADATTLSDTAAKYRAEMQGVNYDVSKLASTSALQSTEFTAALAKIQAASDA